VRLGDLEPGLGRKNSVKTRQLFKTKRTINPTQPDEPMRHRVGPARQSPERKSEGKTKRLKVDEKNSVKLGKKKRETFNENQLVE